MNGNAYKMRSDVLHTAFSCVSSVPRTRLDYAYEGESLSGHACHVDAVREWKEESVL
jgi:hypothetical protein